MTFGVFKELGHDFDGITFHHLFQRPHSDHTPDQDRADLWSFAVAHAADFNFQRAAHARRAEVLAREVH